MVTFQHDGTVIQAKPEFSLYSEWIFTCAFRVNLLSVVAYIFVNWYLQHICAEKRYLKIQAAGC